MFAPTRWLLEIYPIDEILATELKIDLKKIRFEMTPIGSPAYEVDRDGARRRASCCGGRSSRRSSSARSSIGFPTTSTCASRPDGSRPRSPGSTVVDERIATDPERFWDHFQSKTLPALYDHVMALGNGKPRAEDAPFFGELTVDLTLSEPEYRLPVDQEQISSMEALHEEIYFNTHALLRRDGPLHARRRPRVSGPRHSGDASEGRRQGRAARRSRSPASTRRGRRSSSSTPNGTAARGEARLDIPKIAVDRPQTLAGARARRARRHRAARSAREGRHREGRARRARQARRRGARRSHDDVGRAGARRWSRTSAGCVRPVSIATRSRTTISAGSASTVGWEHDSKPGTEVVATLDAERRAGAVA